MADWAEEEATAYAECLGVRVPLGQRLALAAALRSAEKRGYERGKAEPREERQTLVSMLLTDETKLLLPGGGTTTGARMAALEQAAAEWREVPEKLRRVTLDLLARTLVTEFGRRAYEALLALARAAEKAGEK